MSFIFYLCHGCLMLYVMFFVVFFFKQKTAYEMRISDWSSDVCSSDLPAHPGTRQLPQPGAARPSAGAERERKTGGTRGRIGRDRRTAGEIGRASCRGRVCQYV